jgi:hypothetical protein
VCSFLDIFGLGWDAVSYYFSTHGCSLFFSGWAGDFDEPALAIASFWRALMSKKFAIVVVVVDAAFLDCSLVGICEQLPSRNARREYNNAPAKVPPELGSSSQAIRVLCIHQLCMSAVSVATPHASIYIYI